jgi:hypothetical protein
MSYRDVITDSARESARIKRAVVGDMQNATILNTASCPYSDLMNIAADGH